MERFPGKKIYCNRNDLVISNYVKSILKGNIDMKIKNVHTLNSDFICCKGFNRILFTPLVIVDRITNVFNG